MNGKGIGWGEERKKPMEDKKVLDKWKNRNFNKPDVEVV